MPNFKASTIAVSITLLGLGAVGGYAVSSGQDTPASTAAPVEVRTQVHRRIIHVTRHVKARHPRRPDNAGATKGGGATTLASAAGSSVQTSSSGGGSSGGSSSGPSSGSSAPVRTQSSGGGGEHEPEQEQGDD